MKRFLTNLLAISLMLGSITFTSCSSNDDDGPIGKKPHEVAKIDKKSDTALLLCSFGSTYEQPQKTYEAIIADYKKAYPNTDIYLSFTSKTIVNRVYAKIGKEFVQPKIWLKAISDAGYDKVYVQSLHIIPGEEYIGLMKQTVYKDFMGENPDVLVARGDCLLKSEEDIDAVANVLYKYYKPRLDKGEVVVFMGHGNPDKEFEVANKQYTLLEQKMQELSGAQNMIVGTVDWGDKMFGHVRESLLAYAKEVGKESKDITVTLTPLMSIAGDHAQNDMLGGLEDGQKAEDVNAYEDDEDPEFTWILKIKKLGFNINPDGTTTDKDKFNVKGLADHPEIRSIWVEHMKEAVKEATTWNDLFENE